MPDNKHIRKNNGAGKKVGSGVGVVPEDTIATALDPFGSAAGAVTRENLGNKAGEDVVDEDNLGPQNK